MFDVGAGGEVVGMPTMLPIPANADRVPAGWWHATQLLVMPLWLIFEPLNLAPLPTGSDATLDPAPTWQVSHDALVGM